MANQTFCSKVYFKLYIHLVCNFYIRILSLWLLTYNVKYIHLNKKYCNHLTKPNKNLMAFLLSIKSSQRSTVYIYKQPLYKVTIYHHWHCMMNIHFTIFYNLLEFINIMGLLLILQILFYLFHFVLCCKLLNLSLLFQIYLFELILVPVLN